MITVRVDTPLKISGLFSAKLFFSYNEEIINWIKSNVSPCVYNKKGLFWEIPLIYLADTLDMLCHYDQVDLIIDDSEISEISESPLTEIEKTSFKVKPYDHQVEGINYMLEHGKSLLLDAPGLGKTLQLIYYAETLKRRHKIDHCLIIAGINSLKSNWRREIQKVSDELCIIIGEKTKKNGEISPIPMSMKDRVEQLKKPISEFFVIINVESLRSDDIIKAIQTSPNKFGLIAFDEFHKANNKSSAQGSNVLKLKADYQVGLTGTLITNNILNCYLPLNWIDVDHATLTNYKASYCVWGGFNNSQIIGFKNLDSLKEELESCSIRRTKDVAKGLPPKVVTVELLDMDEEHAKFYDAIKDGIKEEADKIELNSSNLLALTTRLRQCTSCPSLLTTQDIISTKIERCVELVEELVEQGEKVVIMSIFKEPVYKLGKLLEKYNPLINTGDVADLKVSQNIEKFQSDPEAKVFIATAAKCGTGITLNAASHLICIDQPWTDALFQQMTDRIHRLDNTTSAFITVLACRDTIDQRVLSIVESKRELSDFVIDDVQNSYANSIKSEMMKIIKEL